MGLVEKPNTQNDMEVFAWVSNEAAIDIFIEKTLLTAAHIRKNTMLVNIEGWGRFRLTFETNPTQA